MIQPPPRSTQSRSSAASDVYKRQTEHGAHEHLDSGVAKQFAKPLLVPLLPREVIIQYLVQYSRLDADRLANARGVVHYHGSEHHPEGEDARLHTILDAYLGCQGAYKGGVGTGHSARAHQPPQIELALLKENHNQLESLRNDPTDQRDDQNMVLQYFQ